MAGAQIKLKAELARVSVRLPAVPVVANVTGLPHAQSDAIRLRLVEQVTATVQWEQSMRYLLAQGFSRFIELGPGTAALSGFMKRIDPNAQVLNVADGPSLDDAAKVLNS